MKYVLIVFLFSVSAFASIVNTLEKGRSVNGVEVAKKIELSTGTTKTELALFGAGLRAKKVVFVDVSVYVASIHLDKVDEVSRDAANVLDSLKVSDRAVVQLSFLRDVDALKVQASFKEALVANGVNVEESGIAALLSAVKNGGEAVKGKSITIALVKSAGEAFYEESSGKVQSFKIASSDFEKILSIWLGKSADDGLLKLKDELLKKVI